MSDSRHVMDGFMKHLRQWEQRGWIEAADVTHGDIFKEIIAWIR